MTSALPDWLPQPVNPVVLYGSLLGVASLLGTKLDEWTDSTGRRREADLYLHRPAQPTEVVALVDEWLAKAGKKTVRHLMPLVEVFRALAQAQTIPQGAEHTIGATRLVQAHGVARTSAWEALD